MGKIRGDAGGWARVKNRFIFPNTQPGLLPRHLRLPDAIAIENLVVIHRHRDLYQVARKGERRVIMRHRRAPIPTDVEAGP